MKTKTGALRSTGF